MPLHADVIDTHPPLEPRGTGMGKIDDCDDAAGIEILRCGPDGMIPAWIKHAKRVGAKDQVETTHRGVVGTMYVSQITNFVPRNVQHVLTEVEAGDCRLREAFPKTEKIATGATTNLQDTGRLDEVCSASQNNLATEQKAPPCGVVDASVDGVITLQAFLRRGGGVHERRSAR